LAPVGHKSGFTKNIQFAITATFIAIVVPSISNLSTLIAVATSGLSVLVLQQFAPSYALIGATLIGIGCGYFSFQEPSIEAQVD
jgi:predicted branched-subunit amino acid permease